MNWPLLLEYVSGWVSGLGTALLIRGGTANVGAVRETNEED